MVAALHPEGNLAPARSGLSYATWNRMDLVRREFQRVRILERDLPMKTLGVALLVLTLLGAVGCTRDASEGPEATTPATREQSAKPVARVAKKPIAGEAEREQSAKPVERVAEKPIPGEADRTFSLTVPFEAVTLTQEGEQPVLIGINRGENFGEQVAIEVSGLPAGVTLETADPVIKPGSTDVTLTLKATADAALGDFTAKVTGHTASSGADFSKELKVTVAQK